MFAALNARILAAAPPAIKNEAPPGAGHILKVVGWVGWGIGLACLVGVLIVCGRMALNHQRGNDVEPGRLFWPVLAFIVAGSAGSILGAVA